MLIKNGIFELSYTNLEFFNNTCFYNHGTFHAWRVDNDPQRGLVMKFKPYNQYNWQRVALDAVELPVKLMTIGVLGPIHYQVNTGTTSSYVNNQIDNEDPASGSASSSSYKNNPTQITGLYCPFINQFTNPLDAINGLFSEIERSMWASGFQNRNPGFGMYIRPTVTFGDNGQMIIFNQNPGIGFVFDFIDENITAVINTLGSFVGDVPRTNLRYWLLQGLDPNIPCNDTYNTYGCNAWRNVFGCGYNLNQENATEVLESIYIPQIISSSTGAGTKSWWSSPFVPFLHHVTSINVHCRQAVQDTSVKQYTRNINDIHGDLLAVVSFSQGKKGPPGDLGSKYCNTGIPGSQSSNWSEKSYFCKNVVNNPTFAQITNRTFCCSMEIEFWFTYGPEFKPLYVPLVLPALDMPGITTYLDPAHSPCIETAYGGPFEIMGFNLFNYACWYYTKVTPHVSNSVIYTNPYQIGTLSTTTVLPISANGTGYQMVSNGNLDVVGNEYIREFCRNSPRIYLSFDSCDCAVDDSKRVTNIGKRLKEEQ